MHEEVMQGMTDGQFKAFLRELLAFVKKAKSVQEIIDHIQEQLDKY